MLKDIVEVKPLEEHKLFLKFEDGVKGEINIAEMIEFKGVFTPLKNKEFFDQVQINRELGSIYWPNGADIDPDVLYAQISGNPIQLNETKVVSIQGT
ncbi:MAG: DUF2442 domain-containing protein [Candidatus Electryonea clarkiae]|nr:DUF2442 domain-containing protein [Candidatus Electryonea clarkiae]MDP8287417.1 DUF2442 domain-containing protein [Candidatus Electryonea clarkiae]